MVVYLVGLSGKVGNTILSLNVGFIGLGARAYRPLYSYAREVGIEYSINQFLFTEYFLSLLDLAKYSITI